MFTFRQAWPTNIWPTVKDKFEELLKHRPAKQGLENDSATGTHFGSKVLTKAVDCGECRNVSGNLAWTDPTANTPMQLGISYEAVAQWVLDTYVDTTAVDVEDPGPPKTLDDADVDFVAASATLSEHRLTRAELLLANKKPWMIPKLVPRGYNIPIAIHSSTVEPEKGQFKRLGFDVAVNGTWLALKWAMDEGATETVAALQRLILGWPFDFIFFEGEADERADAELKWMINIPCEVERLRDFCGLSGNNMIKIVGSVRQILMNKTVSKAEPSAKAVYQWVIEPGKINWGLFHVPSLRTVTELLGNWTTLQANVTASLIMEKALQKFGRENLFDWPSKLAVLIQKSPDQGTLSYLCEHIYAHMLRRNVKDPFSLEEIKARSGICVLILWQRRYIQQMGLEFPCMLSAQAADSAAARQAKVIAQVLKSPLKFFETLEGPNKDPTFVTALPTDALRMFVRHIHEMY